MRAESLWIVGEYWNHNTAYHSELLASLPGPDAAVLDVGCGDGLLVEKFAAKTRLVVGVDPEVEAIDRARQRLVATTNCRVLLGAFPDVPELDGQEFDLITCVATLHHLPLRPALQEMRDKLKPGGVLCVVGLAANNGACDWLVSGALLLPVRIVGNGRGESNYPNMTTTHPSESLTEIRRVALSILPGCCVRRRFFYRYSLFWTKPGYKNGAS